jgi:hypothetical protein
MSAESMPVLSGAVPSFEIFMTRWEKLHDTCPVLRPWIDVGLKWANKYYKRMDDTDAYVVAMCELLPSFLPILTRTDNRFTASSPQSLPPFRVDQSLLGKRFCQAF